MYKLLIVDDEPSIREAIKEYAEFLGNGECEVTEAEDGMKAVELSRANGYDVIILDVMTPKLDGFSACKEIRKFSDAPIIMLSARTEEYDKLFGFEMGADDYVEKPFSPKELMARVNAMLKRGRSGKLTPSIEVRQEFEKFGGLEINATAREVKVDDKRLNLTPKEFDLLFYLARNKNIALSRERLLEEVWGYDFFGDDRTIDTHIKMLRGNLGKYRGHIVTLRGVGYKFDPNVKF